MPELPLAIVDGSRNWADSILSVLIPRRCPICGTSLADRSRAWCENCEAGMRAFECPVCSECRRFLLPGETECPTGHLPSDPAIVYALGAFDGAFGACAHALKYDGFRDLAQPLGGHLADRIAGANAGIIVAVPTSPRKRRKRGYGHAEEIAAACAQAAGLIFAANALTFTRPVADQTRLNASERHANLSGALTASGGMSFAGAHVLVIDDVMTTGATMREAARAVKAAGAESVSGAVVALNLSMQTRGN